MSSSKFVFLALVFLLLGIYSSVLGMEEEDATTAVVEDHHQHRELQFPPTGTGVLAGLRPVNPQTDQRGSIYSSFSSSFGNYVEYDWVDSVRTKTTNIEAVVTNTTNVTTIGSVKFQLCQFLGGVEPCVTIIENTYPYALCANKGMDFFPCTNYSFLIGQHPSINATAYSGRNGTGSVLGWTAPIKFVIYGMNDPKVFMWVINAQTDTRMLRLDPIGSPPTFPGDDHIRNVSQKYYGISSFQLNFELGWEFSGYGRGDWTPIGMLCNYNNGTAIRNETTAPYACFGNNGTDFYSFGLGLGLHTLDVTVYRPPGVFGLQRSFAIRVVP